MIRSLAHVKASITPTLLLRKTHWIAKSRSLISASRLVPAANIGELLTELKADDVLLLPPFGLAWRWNLDAGVFSARLRRIASATSASYSSSVLRRFEPVSGEVAAPDGSSSGGERCLSVAPQSPSRGASFRVREIPGSAWRRMRSSLPRCHPANLCRNGLRNVRFLSSCWPSLGPSPSARLQCSVEIDASGTGEFVAHVIAASFGTAKTALAGLVVIGGR